MIRFKEYITELFDSPVPYTGDEGIYTFELDGHTIEAVFNSGGKYTSFEFKLDKSYNKKTLSTPLEDTQILKLFSTIKSIFEDYMYNNTPKEIRFSANDDNKVSLYTTFAKMIAKRYKYKLHIEDSTMIKNGRFILRKI